MTAKRFFEIVMACAIASGIVAVAMMVFQYPYLAGALAFAFFAGAYIEKIYGGLK